MTFPNVLDSSETAQKAIMQYETLMGMSAMPMTYVIDRQGKIVDSWYGYSEDKTKQAIKKLGL